MINTKVTKFIKEQSHRGSNRLLCAKETKRGGRKLISHFELFQQVQFVKFYFYMNCRIQKPIKLLQGSFLYVLMYQKGGKTLSNLQYISR